MVSTKVIQNKSGTEIIKLFLTASISPRQLQISWMPIIKLNELVQGQEKYHLFTEHLELIC